MPQLRLALARSTPLVGDLAGNAAVVRERTGRPPDAGAHLVAFPEMALTGLPGRGPRAAPASSRSVPRALSTDRPPARRRRARRPPRRRRLSRRRPSRRRLGVPEGAPQNAAAVLHGGRVVGALRQAPPAQLRRVRRVPLFVPGQDLPSSRAARRRRGRRDLRGHLAGRRPGRATRATGAGLLVVHQRVALRGEQGRRPPRARPPGGRPRPGARSPTSTSSAARTTSSSTATPSSSPPTAGAGPRAAVRGAPARRRPGPPQRRPRDDAPTAARAYAHVVLSERRSRLQPR